MQVIQSKNVNDALRKGLDLLEIDGDYRDSRAGRVLEASTPVTTTFQNPNERVLFSPERDAHPFFHFIESLWMLSGAKDVETVAFYVKRMETFSDDGETLWGAYGHRWRSYFHKDQIKMIIEALQRNPDDRRCVLQMWDANKDLGKAGLDVPCNTNIYFKIRDNKLFMTVCCRSNDIIWGAYGANAVHMSMLQEFIAGAVGVELGEYSQISDSYHAYQEVYENLREQMPNQDYYAYKYPLLGYNNEYELDHINSYPIISVDYNTWLNELDMFMYELKRYKHKAYKLEAHAGFQEPFFREVAIPIARSYALYKDGNIDLAIKETQTIKATDWSLACDLWLHRRKETKESHKDIEAVL
jgi:thymidylate synthase|tara:strand:+ start:6008 stop:7075 length:1068 start_codon:yes stop_codon:yes gene_type:complete